MVLKKLEILIIIKPIWKFPKHQPKLDMIRSLETYAEVHYWHEDGHIEGILKTLAIKPDFIFHYDIAWNYSLAPKIEGLDKIDIPTGCFVIDLHWEPDQRVKYIEENRIDLIFSVSKNPFLTVFPQFKQKLCWLPWSINPAVMKDWRKQKDIDSLLMGLVYVEKNNLSGHILPKQIPFKGRYAFRDAVFEQLKATPGFVFHPHQGHLVTKSKNLIVNEDYAKELNRAKIFYTCGSRNKTGGLPVLKFFEALACKTLLLAETNEDVEELGFKDGVNFVACTIDTIIEKTNYYLMNDQERQKISENGFHFIHANHTNAHRAKQMIDKIHSNI